MNIANMNPRKWVNVGIKTGKVGYAEKEQTAQRHMAENNFC